MHLNRNRRHAILLAYAACSRPFPAGSETRAATREYLTAARRVRQLGLLRGSWRRLP